MWAELCVAHGNRAGGEAEAGGDPKEQKRLRLQAWCEVLEAVTLRDHMTVTCSECEVLTRLYKQQLKQLEREECHAHLRCVNFDLSLRLPSGSLDDYVTRASESAGEASLDRCTSHTHKTEEESVLNPPSPPPLPPPPLPPPPLPSPPPLSP